MNAQVDSIFTKIIKGEIPCHKVFEDDQTISFLDIHPIQPGHVLVVSKTQAETVWELDQTDYQALMQTAQTVARKLRQAFSAKKRIAMVIEGLDVAHAHVHLVPIDSDEELRSRPDMNAEPDHPSLAALAQKLAIKED